VNPPDLHAANRRAAWTWGSIIVGLLSLQVAGGVVAIILATGDQSVAVVPDYHQKALQWDNEMAIRRASQQLGWTCDVRSVPFDADQRGAGLVVNLVDRQGETVQVAQGTLRWYQHTRANDVKELAIPARRLTTMRLDDCFHTNGLWEVMIDVTDRDGNRFVHSVTLNIDGVTITEAT
jgi:hypothetical protein